MGGGRFSPRSPRHGSVAGVSAPASRLDRRLGVPGAVAVGLGSMMGTGVFVVPAPAAAAAGSWLLAALALAGLVATANALSSAQLAAAHPTSGGTYAYGRARLGDGWGFLAGSAFLVGKTASCAVAALAVGRYLAPEHERWVALAVVVGSVALGRRGVTRTVRATVLLLVLLAPVLGLVVVAGVLAPSADLARLWPLSGAADAPGGMDPGPAGVLQGAGLLFFAFAGYARVATLGEEVRDPARTLPRAVPRALALVLLVYLLVLGAALAALGPAGLAAARAPLEAVVAAGPWAAAAPAVRVAAAAAATGAFLALLAGLSRTAFAMAAEGDLPRRLAAVHPQSRVPHRAEEAVGVLAAVGVLVGTLETAVGLSAATVLLYYAVTHAAALRLPSSQRRWSPAWAWGGLVGCCVLAASLPVVPVGVAVLLLAGALLARAVVRRRTARGG